MSEYNWSKDFKLKPHTQLQIIQRENEFVIQIRKQKLITRGWYWVDLDKHIFDGMMYIDKKMCWSGLNFHPNTKYKTFEEADKWCKVYYKRGSVRKEGKTIKTYNTGIHDQVWPEAPPMPKCKPSKKPSEIDLLELGATSTKCKPPRGSIKYTDGSDVFPEDDDETNM